MPFLVFYVTHPNEATARTLSEHLVRKRLAACANISPVSSLYRWEGAVQQDHEWVSILKTRPELEHLLEAEIQSRHPYEVPCIMRFEVRANAAYEQWIAAQTGEEG